MHVWRKYMPRPRKIYKMSTRLNEKINYEMVGNCCEAKQSKRFKRSVVSRNRTNAVVCTQVAILGKLHSSPLSRCYRITIHRLRKYQKGFKWFRRVQKRSKGKKRTQVLLTQPSGSDTVKTHCVTGGGCSKVQVLRVIFYHLSVFLSLAPPVIS